MKPMRLCDTVKRADLSPAIAGIEAARWPSFHAGWSGVPTVCRFGSGLPERSRRF